MRIRSSATLVSWVRFVEVRSCGISRERIAAFVVSPRPIPPSMLLSCSRPTILQSIAIHVRRTCGLETMARHRLHVDHGCRHTPNILPNQQTHPRTGAWNRKENEQLHPGCHLHRHLPRETKTKVPPRRRTMLLASKHATSKVETDVIHRVVHPTPLSRVREGRTVVDLRPPRCTSTSTPTLFKKGRNVDARHAVQKQCTRSCAIESAKGPARGAPRKERKCFVENKNSNAYGGERVFIAAN